MRRIQLMTFLLVAISIWTAINLYVFWRAGSVLVGRFVPAGAFVACGAILASSYPLAKVLSRKGFPGAGGALEVMGATWMGLLFLAFTALFLVDLATGFGRLAPSLVVPTRGGAIATALVLAAVAQVQGLRPPAVREYEIRLNGLPRDRDGIAVVLVSDLHLGSLLGARWLGARVAEVEALKPDLLVLCGDVVDDDVRPVRALLPLLSRFSAPLGVFAVTGNHEIYAGLPASVRLLQDAGIRVLRDESVEAAPGLVVAGVDDLTARGQLGGERGDPVARALTGRPSGATIFLSHTPWRAEEAARLGASVMLCGHTHAGQIWPFGALVKLRYPLLAGRHDVGGMPVVVCRGTGTWGPRMRLFRRAEIVRIRLRAGL